MTNAQIERSVSVMDVATDAQAQQIHGDREPQRQVYMDYAATTPTDPRVIERMIEFMGPTAEFGNAASRSHAYGWKAEEAVEAARGQVAELIGADAREIVWTSGATESDNLAIKGAAHFYAEQRGRHIITSRIEHKAVLDSCRQLEREGFELSYLEPDANGLVSAQAVAEALRDDTVLVSLMHANNEIGTVNDIEAIGAVTRERGVLFHCDAAQSAGKIPLNVERAQVDLLSLSAHKIYGPKGIGALYVRRRPRVRITAQQHGGGHERGMRSGTLATHQIVGMGAAMALAAQEMPIEAARLAALRSRLWDGVKDIEQVFLNGHPERRLPGLLNISINFVEGESLLMALKDVAVSSGSACTSTSLEPSYVLRALGLDDELAHSSLRFSMGRYTTEAEVDQVLEQLHSAVERLRALSPLWDMHRAGVDISQVQWAS